jgi:hypothetical protein
MEEAMRLYNTNLLRMRQFNWSNILSHPSEFIRIDETLRLKQIELNQFTDTIPGWTLVAAQENLDHKRLIYRMRVYLHIAGTNLFGHPILSREEFHNLKRSNNFETGIEYIKSPEDNLEILTSSTPTKFWLIMSTSFDRLNTINFFKKMIFEILGTQYTKAEKELMSEIVIKRCDFMIERGF